MSNPSHKFAEPCCELSSRERAVLALVACGYSNKIIARELGISPLTVKNHVQHMLPKLRARNRTHAAAMAAGVLQVAA